MSRVNHRYNGKTYHYYGDRPAAFHLQDGWYFQRGEDGTVAIYKQDRYLGVKEYQVEVFKLLEIDPSGWASIVSSVSALGETGPRWREALDFHGNPLK